MSTSKAYRKPATVQIQARFTGNLQWICPLCANMNAGRKEKVDWRGPTAQCSRCEGRFSVGLAFRDAISPFGPLDGWYSTTICGWTANVIDHLPPGRPMTGRLAGTIWWICLCRILHKSVVDWQTGQIACKTCKTCYNVGVVLYKALRGRHPSRRTPLDWTLPVWDVHDPDHAQD